MLGMICLPYVSYFIPAIFLRDFYSNVHFWILEYHCQFSIKLLVCDGLSSRFLWRLQCSVLINIRHDMAIGLWIDKDRFGNNQLLCVPICQFSIILLRWRPDLVIDFRTDGSCWSVKFYPSEYKVLYWISLFLLFSLESVKKTMFIIWTFVIIKVLFTMWKTKSKTSNERIDLILWCIPFNWI